jgi:aldehyde dehydrogenase (NAD+)
MRYESRNPHAPDDVVVRFELATAGDVEHAVGEAVRVAGAWSVTPAHVRMTALSQLAQSIEDAGDELVRLIAREVGKPIREARGEVARTVAIHRYFAQAALAPDGRTHPATSGTGWLITRRRPIGVCGLITPWNFPLAIPAWKAAPAIAFGNPVVLKPAPDGTAVALRYGELACAVLPDGVLEVLPGDAEAGTALVQHEAVGAVSFTGSRQVGREVARIAFGRGACVQCELSGNNASIVLADADQQAAADVIASAAMAYAGQKCTATNRVIVESAIADSFTEKLVASVERLQLIDPMDEQCDIGPLISAAAVSAAEEALDRLGGRVLTGGAAQPGHAGFYLRPTLVEVDAGVHPGADEIFACVASVAEAPDGESALEAANAGPLGLVAAVFTSRLDRAMEYADRLDTGLVRVNAPTSGVDYHVPFGGLKASSIGGREQGEAAHEFFTEERTLLVERPAL